MKNTQTTSNLEKITIQITRWMGTTTSIVIHTIFFVVVFSLFFFGFTFDKILLILTTVVSLEAIYLSLFIQMTVNRNTESLEEVEEDIEEIQEDVEGVEDDIDELQKDFEGVEDDIDEIQEDVEDIGEDMDKIHAKPKILPPHPTLSEQLDHITQELAAIKEQLKKPA
jgi:methyl-accepting chemotaxis protein